MSRMEPEARLVTRSRIAVLASGGGSNLQALLDRFHTPPADIAQVALVVTSRRDAGALERATRAGVPTLVLDPRSDPEAHPPALLRALQEARAELVVLAGYLHLIPQPVVEAFQGRMLNVHPALLPAFGGAGMYGMRVHRAVLASGARVSGATVHLVDERYDEGRIVAQWPVPVLPGDTPEALAERVLRVEHRLLPAAVEAILRPATDEPIPSDAAFILSAAGCPLPDDVEALSR